jgi:hypothetical protein
MVSVHTSSLSASDVSCILSCLMLWCCVTAVLYGPCGSGVGLGLETYRDGRAGGIGSVAGRGEGRQRPSSAFRSGEKTRIVM